MFHQHPALPPQLLSASAPWQKCSLQQPRSCGRKRPAPLRACAMERTGEGARCVQGPNVKDLTVQGAGPRSQCGVQHARGQGSCGCRLPGVRAERCEGVRQNADERKIHTHTHTKYKHRQENEAPEAEREDGVCTLLREELLAWTLGIGAVSRLGGACSKTQQFTRCWVNLGSIRCYGLQHCKPCSPTSMLRSLGVGFI